MKQTLLGLDIGASSIKGVRFAKTLRGLRLLDHFEIDVPQNDEKTNPALLTKGQIQALTTLVSEGDLQKGDLIALSIPGDLVSIREITLPFTDLKKIDQIISFEAESELPFELDTVSLDYMVLNLSKNRASASGVPQDKSTTLLVAATPNTTLIGLLNQLQSIGIDPAWIGTNPLALYSFAQYFLPAGTDETHETLIIDIGAKRTNLCHLRGRHLNWVRTLPLGGHLITEQLAAALALSKADAEKKKKEIDLGTARPGDTEDTPALEAIESAVSQIVIEIEKSLRILNSHQNGRRDEGPSGLSPNSARRFFHLCGGGSQLKGLETHLSKILEMQPAHIAFEKGTPAAQIQGIERISPESISKNHALSLGLAVQDSAGPFINFRQGEFVFGKETIERRHRFVSFSLILLLLLGLMGADLYMHHQKKEKQYHTIKTALRQAFTQSFPNTRNVVNEVEQTRAAINERKKTGEFFGIHESSPLTVLKEITEAIPDGVKIDVINLVIDGGTVRIQAQTDSFESVDRVRSGLLSANQFQQVEVSDAKAAANQKHVRFRIKMSVLQKGKSGKNRAS